MGCSVCGSSYRGLAGDCDCTSYSDGTERAYTEEAYAREKARADQIKALEVEFGVNDKVWSCPKCGVKWKYGEICSDCGYDRGQEIKPEPKTFTPEPRRCEACGTTTGGDGVPCAVCFLWCDRCGHGPDSHARRTGGCEMREPRMRDMAFGYPTGPVCTCKEYVGRLDRLRLRKPDGLRAVPEPITKPERRRFALQGEEV